ncbi:NR5A2 protein, partial [Atractosteus spatula]|nr:NR5A2 protein [Atractosteus spatula]
PEMSVFSSDPPSELPFLPGDFIPELLGKEASSASCSLPTAPPVKPEAPRESCPICGDRVSGYHYGLLTCESCKGFFKRTVQNNKQYACAERQRCPIDTMQRKRCPYCRFQKCLSVGMRREAVRADRMRGGRNKFGPLYRRDRQLKQQKRADLHSAPCRFKAESPAGQPGAMHGFQAALAAVPTPTEPPPAAHRPPAHPSYPPQGLYSHAQARFPLPALPGPPAPAGLSEMLRWEPEESQLCARILASLQREQASRGKHDRLNTFGIMCKMAEQTLLGLVEWARRCAIFKELPVEDQMALLQGCWSELLVLDHLYRQVAYGKEGSIYLVTGQQIEVSTVLSQAGDTLASLVSRAQDLVSRLRTLQLDRQEFVCLKYLVLFNPDVRGLRASGQVERVQEGVNRTLMEHTMAAHPGQTDKFGQLLLKLPEVRGLSLQTEEYLYLRHLQGDLPCNSLLTEMLHAKQA